MACEEAARLTADIQDENTPDDDDEMCEYHDMPPPPDGGLVFLHFLEKETKKLKNNFFNEFSF